MVLETVVPSICSAHITTYTFKDGIHLTARDAILNMCLASQCGGT